MIREKLMLTDFSLLYLTVLTTYYGQVTALGAEKCVLFKAKPVCLQVDSSPVKTGVVEGDGVREWVVKCEWICSIQPWSKFSGVSCS